MQEQEQHGWGAKVIDRLTTDLRREFPDMSGFSPRNLKYMRRFAEQWPDDSIAQAALAQITRYRNITLISPFIMSSCAAMLRCREQSRHASEREAVAGHLGQPAIRRRAVGL